MSLTKYDTEKNPTSEVDHQNIHHLDARRNTLTMFRPQKRFDINNHDEGCQGVENSQ